MSRYFYINHEKEISDIDILSSRIIKDGWVDKKTLIVVCSPEYSSLMCQVMNHQICKLTRNVPLDMISLDMPYAGGEEFDYMEYNQALCELGEKLHGTDKKALLVDSGVLRGMNFTIASRVLSRYTHSQQVKYACLYKQSTSVFNPDYYVEEFDFVKDGGLLFWWENPNIPYWNY